MNVCFKWTKAKSNFPFIVEAHNTENWNSCSGHSDIESATKEAVKLAHFYPRLAIRVNHFTMGPMLCD
jgi:hypothetical protein